MATVAACVCPALAQKTVLSASQQQAEQKLLDSVASASRSGPFQPNWNSLGAYRAPEWFRDAKFGIFLHWGVYSVPPYANEWYSRNIYVQGSDAFKHQVATYGPLSKFGYKDFIPMFHAEHFDANAWLDLFTQAGARYVVPVAEHCDGFPMYDSSVTDWDAAKMGPKRDVVGELEAATRRHGLHFGVSSHRAEHWWWYGVGTTFDSDVRDPRYAGLYGPAAPMALPGELDDPNKEPNAGQLQMWVPPDKAYLDDWLARSSELVSKYHPDFLYFDWWIGQPAFAPYLQRFAAYYYDVAASRHQGVVLTYKGNDFPDNAATLDLERGRIDTLRLLPWQTDTSVSIHSWGYVEHDEYRTAKSLIGELVDVVSKNGNLLLNVGPKSDGTIPDEARAILLQMGAWLKVNGEAIYGSRPWVLYGEGPVRTTTAMTAPANTRGSDRQQYTAEDIRFTTHNGALYAIALGWPSNGDLRIRTLASGLPYLKAPICAVKLLGSQAPISFHQEPDGLHIALPSQPPDEPVYTFRIVESQAQSGGCAN